MLQNLLRNLSEQIFSTMSQGRGQLLTLEVSLVYTTRTGNSFSIFIFI